MMMLVYMPTFFVVIIPNMIAKNHAYYATRQNLFTVTSVYSPKLFHKNYQNRKIVKKTVRN